MSTQNQIHYNRIAEAIKYFIKNFKRQPDLDEIAEHVHLRPAHFQRLFTEWAGTSPQKFFQYISIEHAKDILTKQQATLFDTAFETGLSSTIRLHDLFVKTEEMTPAEYKNGGRNLHIHYCFEESPFGNLIVASTQKGVCFLAFQENEGNALSELTSRFPNAVFQQRRDHFQENALFIFQNDWNKPGEIKLHLKGTDFQLKVWECLLKIPFGRLSTYGKIAEETGTPNAYRAVGTAVGSNPVAFLIPCHRVIQASGKFAGYHWGTIRKTAIIGWEQAKINL